MKAPGAAPRTLVFTDVDETLLRGKSLLDFLGYYLAWRYGTAGAARAHAVLRDLAARGAAGASREELNRAYYRAWHGEPEAAVAIRGRHWFAERSCGEGFFLSGTLRALRAHRALGAAVVLVSGSCPAALAPVAEAVGAVEVLCAGPEVRLGRFTGALVGPPMIGEAKRAAVRRVLARHPDIAPADCYAYGDDASDLPMLSEVGHPVVVGPSPALRSVLPAAVHLQGH